LNCLLKHVNEGNTEERMEAEEYKEEDASSLWMIFRKREVTGN
jgi:hypothetical protein